MVVPIGLSAVAEPLDPLGEPGVPRDDRAAVAQRAEVLGWIEAERAGRSNRADRTSIRGREVGLTAVLDDREPVRGGDPFDARHVGRLPVEMDRHDSAGARGHRPFDRSRVDRETVAIDVRKDRAGADHHDRQRRERRRQRRRNDLIAGADAEGAERERNRVGAAADANRERRSRGRRELPFERLDLRPEHEPSAREDAIDRGSYWSRIFEGDCGRERHAQPGHTRSAARPGWST